MIHHGEDIPHNALTDEQTNRLEEHIAGLADLHDEVGR
jgi:hypothetical protein